MKYVNEIIGERYKEWRPGDSIYISSQTGTGKTTFILDTLVKYYATKDKKVLYLVNRSALEKQLRKEVSNRLSIKQQGAIYITTYQDIEEIYSKAYMNEASFDYYDGYTFGRDVTLQEARKELHELGYLFSFDFQINGINVSRYDCIICDECHYFLADSNFNTKTIFSYNFVKNEFDNKIKIFMSATMEDIYNRIQSDKKKYYYPQAGIMNVMIKKQEIPCLQTNWFCFDTGVLGKESEANHSIGQCFTERNYDYVDIGIVKSIKEITELVFEEDGRWLIFVESKYFGETLKKEIKKQDEKKRKNKRNQKNISIKKWCF